MTRRQRFHSPNSFYHVMLRGNNGQNIFFFDEDRCKFCLMIQKMSEQFQYQVHGFCLMSNHVHLLIEVSTNSISKSVQQLAFRYARYFNQKHDRTGHLFQGRFKSLHVNDNDYLLELIRYIHRNPVCAGLVDKAEDFRWSGHNAYLGKECFVWLMTERILARFDKDINVSRQIYNLQVNKKLDIGLQIDKQDSFFHFYNSLSIDDNQSEEKKILEDFDINQPPKYILEDVINSVCGILQKPVSILNLPGKDRIGSHARSLVSYFIKRNQHIGLKEFADLVKKDPSTLSKQARDIEIKAQNDLELLKILKDIENSLMKIE